MTTRSAGSTACTRRWSCVVASSCLRRAGPAEGGEGARRGPDRPLISSYSRIAGIIRRSSWRSRRFIRPGKLRRKFIFRVAVIILVDICLQNLAENGEVSLWEQSVLALVSRFPIPGLPMCDKQGEIIKDKTDDSKSLFVTTLCTIKHKIHNLTKINIINKKLTLINPNGYVAQHLSILGQIEYPQALLILSRSVPRLVYSVAAVLAEVV